jgi:ABC-type sugar transport system permease subunit
MAYSSTRQSFLTGARPVRSYRRPSRDARTAFPELEPADAGRTTSGLSRRISGIRFKLATQFNEIRDNPDTDNALSRLAVYTLNAVLLILAFPVGFAMLMFNVLVGENLRTTIHVLALTGLAVTLSQTETAARVLGLG